ncbi:hypothetical protein KCU57_00670 [Xanthomonas translucens]|uniref:hypothetical protein n=1 Tax=Xanthomonas campestris pv. translucens TaxID=343 RepID=UPI001F20606E|nr:hypothetical protein [Xanthomonas translucens]UKE50971.1 hypothetical protein KCU57_00670 [Xanthomonas translucens]
MNELLAGAIGGNTLARWTAEKDGIECTSWQHVASLTAGAVRRRNKGTGNAHDGRFRRQV